MCNAATKFQTDFFPTNSLTVSRSVEQTHTHCPVLLPSILMMLTLLLLSNWNNILKISPPHHACLEILQIFCPNLFARFDVFKMAKLLELSGDVFVQLNTFCRISRSNFTLTTYFVYFAWNALCNYLPIYVPTYGHFLLK